MKSRMGMVALSLAAAILFGVVIRPLAALAERNQSAENALASLDRLKSGLGQGVSLALLGGYRSLAANLVWLSMNRHWEAEDFNKTLLDLELATAIDPRPEFFWINGARIIANDMPAWRVGAFNTAVLDVTQEGIALKRRFGRRALEFLEGSEPVHPNDPLIAIEEGIIYWRKLDDLENAAEKFLAAARLPGGPYFAARVHAELLVKLGRFREALEFLEEHYATLPDDDLQAMKPVVADRIRQLREQLASETKQR